MFYSADAFNFEDNCDEAYDICVRLCWVGLLFWFGQENFLILQNTLSRDKKKLSGLVVFRKV